MLERETWRTGTQGHPPACSKQAFAWLAFSYISGLPKDGGVAAISNQDDFPQMC